MEKEFLESLLTKHQTPHDFPLTSSVTELASKLLFLMFPEKSKEQFNTVEELHNSFLTLEAELVDLLDIMKHELEASSRNIAKGFFLAIPTIYEKLLTDIKAIMMGDPAARSEYEIIRAYPGFYAIALYRIAHQLYSMQVPLLPRIITEYAHSKTGIDIHPGAQIGSYFFIDHGTGIVIGETAQIGEYVKIYQGVTLGALSVEKHMANTKRHPTLENNVVIYSGATILGGETIIGKNSIIGGNVWLTKSLPPYSTVYHQAQIKIRNKNSETVNS